MGKIASAKQTGQGGTSYEDKTNAYFLACMLTQTSPFGLHHGMIQKIRFQTRVDGWLFDDSLLTLEKSGTAYQMGVSIKSAGHFTTQGCSSEINRLLWEQYLGVENKVFNPANDFLCLVQSPLTVSVSESLNTVLQQALAQEAKELFDRNQIKGYNSVEKRKLFNSFACPADLATAHGVDAKEIGKALKRFLQLEFDFEKQTSLTENKITDLCRTALTDKSQPASTALYKRLCQVARDMASVSGTVDLGKLVSILRDEHGLVAFPSYREDWKKIETNTIEKLSVIRDDIGGSFKLSRTTTIAQIENCFTKSAGCMLSGISGGGKTSVAKIFAQVKLDENSRVLWIDGADAQNDLFHIKLSLDHPIATLIKAPAEKPGYIIVDGVEKMYDSTIQKWLSVILNSAFAQNNKWKVLFTFPVDSVDFVQQILHENNLQVSFFGKCQLQQLDEGDITLLIKSFPQIARFFVQDTMRVILSNLKLLDSILADAVKLELIAELGETQLIDFIWTNQIEKTSAGLQKSAFLKMLSEKQADQLKLSTSSSEFTIPDIAPGGELVKDRFLVHSNEHFSFVHDLYGDWSRYKLLLSRVGDIKTFLSSKHLASPLWSRSIRLWGISLLEKNKDSAEWKKQFDLFNSGTMHDKNVQDLLLESFVFASNTYELLQQAKPILFADNGNIFKRLMKIFNVRATTSNPETMELAKSLGIAEADALSLNRLPVMYYWIDFLRFLHENTESVASFDFVLLSELAGIWIKNTSRGFLLRKEAIDIVCVVAEKLFQKQMGGFVETKTADPIYQSLLNGYMDNPEKIKKLALQIAKRLPYEKKTVVNEADTDITLSAKIDLGTPVGRGIIAPLKRKKEQWADGPYERVDKAFQNACLSKNAIYPILENAPELATELLLAVIIDEPTDLYEHSHGSEDYSIHSPTRWYPPFFLRGPFIDFFRLHPEHAIRFTNRLIDFVTERHIDNQQGAKAEEFSINTTFDGIIKVYKGDSYTFLWHKDMGSAPHLIVSLLMAFEQFLYEEIEAKRDISNYVRIAVSETNSLAIVGLLLVTAKFKTDLYTKELLHLLPHPIFMMWDSHSRDHGLHDNFFDLPKVWHEQVQKWKRRSNGRFFPLKDALLNRFLVDSDFQEKFKTVTDAWEKEIEGIDPQSMYVIYIRQCVAQLKMENWSLNEKGEFIYDEPEVLTEDLAEGRKGSLDILDYGGFSYRSRQTINGDQPFTLEMAEDCWQKMEGFIGKINDESVTAADELGAWASPYTNVLAAMATLINFRSTWEVLHPEYLSFIKNYCVTLIKKRKLSDEYYEKHATMDDWTTFMSEMAPVLWKNNVNDEDCRSLVAGCCILFSQPATQRLLKSAAAQFKWSEPSFIQVQNLLLLFSSDLDTFHPHYESPKSLSEIRGSLIDRFVNDQISTQPLTWGSVRQPKKWISKETDNWRCTDHPDLMLDKGLRTDILVPLFKNLPAIETIQDTEERRHILFLLEQSFQQLIYEYGNIEETSVPINNYPGDFALAILQHLASELISIPDEKREAYWKPLLAYGYIIKKPIDIFCKYFFLKNLQLPERHDKMAEVLDQMVTFTLAAPSWKSKHVFRHEDFRLSIVGMQHDLLSIWTDDYTVFMNKAKPTYIRWFAKMYINPFAVLSLLEFITTKSGEFIIRFGLTIINGFFKIGVAMTQGPQPKNMVYVGHPEHDAKLAIALSHLWKIKKDIITEDDTSFNTYKDLVQYLVSINNPVGIDLQEKLMLG